MRWWAIAGTVALLAPTGLPVGAFDLRPSESRVEFFVKDNRGGFTGETRDVAATVTVRARGDGYGAEVEAKIDARTIRTGAGLRDAQLRSATFLNTGAFPFITFSGTVTADSPQASPFRGTLRGRLTVKKVSREIEMPLEIAVEGNAYAARGEVAVRFTDFDLPVPRFLFFVAEDLITIRLAVRLSPKNG